MRAHARDAAANTTRAQRDHKHCARALEPARAQLRGRHCTRVWRVTHAGVRYLHQRAQQHHLTRDIWQEPLSLISWASLPPSSCTGSRPPCAAPPAMADKAEDDVEAPSGSLQQALRGLRRARIFVFSSQ
eukprot:12977850-Alexandrium_andersonii.AAC.1